MLINTGVFLDYRWHYLARIWRTPIAGEVFQATTTRSGLRMALRHGNPRGLPRAFVDRMYDDLDAGTNRAVLRLYRATDDPSAVGRRPAGRLRPLTAQHWLCGVPRIRTCRFRWPSVNATLFPRPRLWFWRTAALAIRG